MLCHLTVYILLKSKSTEQFARCSFTFFRSIFIVTDLNINMADGNSSARHGLVFLIKHSSPPEKTALPAYDPDSFTTCIVMTETDATENAAL